MSKISLVLGGARSGKSGFAERLADATDRPKTYIATAQAFDVEMTARIAKHRFDRGPGWTTIEAPRDIIAALKKADPTSVILIDCMTLWLSNLLLAKADIAVETTRFLDHIARIPNPVICVSNEVGMGLVPENPLGREFRDAQGILNQRLAKRADLAVFIAAGLPLVLKGTLP
ncbi:MAG: bifunctional adenosylcobinamide kinase/adenosylcobinamide-phosphate guanylyltransferase [Paracoccaceae bacterium]